MPAYPPSPLPPGRLLDLPGRGTTFIREVAGPAGAPTLLLLHGWLATSALNWHACFAPLGRHFHVVAIDQRGHGMGIHSRRPFRLTDCADDAAAVIRLLRIGPVIACGYSMGGPVAQLLWQRHPDTVRGLVLCATSRNFPMPMPLRLVYTAVAAGVRVAPRPLRRRVIGTVLSPRQGSAAARDFVAAEVALHDGDAMLEAGRELGRFDSSPWIGGVDVPAAVVTTLRDELVPLANQRGLAAAIPGARVHEVDGDHIVCATRPRLFVPALLSACTEVAGRRTRARRAQDGAA